MDGDALRFQVEWDETKDSVWMRRTSGRTDWDDARATYFQLERKAEGAYGVYQYGRTTYGDGTVRNVVLRDVENDG